MDTFDIATIGSPFVTRIATFNEGPCRHFNIEMDGDLEPWACAPRFICTKCRATFSRERALAIRDMHESQL